MACGVLNIASSTAADARLPSIEKTTESLRAFKSESELMLPVIFIKNLLLVVVFPLLILRLPLPKLPARLYRPLNLVLFAAPGGDSLDYSIVRTEVSAARFEGAAALAVSHERLRSLSGSCASLSRCYLSDRLVDGECKVSRAGIALLAFATNANCKPACNQLVSIGLGNYIAIPDWAINQLVKLLAKILWQTTRHQMRVLKIAVISLRSFLYQLRRELIHHTLSCG